MNKNTNDKGQEPIFSNIRIFYTIAQESLEDMRSYEKKYSRPKPNGEPGKIKTFDPDRRAFKNALITIVFCGVCFDALLHLLIGTRLGLDKCKKTDNQKYEDKLILLGCKDEMLLKACKRFRETRREVVHEKAFFGEMEFKVAQREAEESKATLDSVCKFLNINLS